MFIFIFVKSVLKNLRRGEEMFIDNTNRLAESIYYKIIRPLEVEIEKLTEKIKELESEIEKQKNSIDYNNADNANEINVLQQENEKLKAEIKELKDNKLMKGMSEDYKY